MRIKIGDEFGDARRRDETLHRMIKLLTDLVLCV